MNIKKLLPFFVALLALVTCVGINTTTATAKTRSVPTALRGKWYMEGNEAQLSEQITLTVVFRCSPSLEQHNRSHHQGNYADI